MLWRDLIVIAVLVLVLVGIGIEASFKERRQFEERLRRRLAVDDAARRIRDQAAWAFQSMLDEARRHGR